MLSMNRPLSARNFATGALMCLVLAPASAASIGTRQPLQFFSGRTEMISVVKVMAKRPYRSRTMGDGRILPDGSLALVQQVFDDGKSPERRNWKMHQVGPGRYAGTMSDAVGPVLVEEVNGSYRFKFRMKGGLSIEQWLTPVPGAEAAKTNMTARKFGFRVATSQGFVRRI